MPFHHFRYTYDPFSRSAAFPNGGLSRQARLDVELSFGNKTWASVSVIDSGASQCLFPTSAAKKLGIDIYKLPTSLVRGVSGEDDIAYHCPVRLTYPGVFALDVYVGFTRGLERLGFGLLGHDGFLDRVTVIFNHRLELFTIET